MEWGDGYDAALRGCRRDENPHPPGSAQHQRWSDGWKEANVK